MVKKRIKNFWDLVDVASSKGLSVQVYEMLDIVKRDLLLLPRTDKNAIELINGWLEAGITRADITEHRIGYFLLYEILKALRKKR